MRKAGLVGTLFVPPESEPRPVVVVLGSSGGGLREESAAMLASHGLTALALAYFGVPHVPLGLVKLPLKYFEAGYSCLRG